MKKLFAAVLSLVLIISITPAALATNGKGAGLAAAPGQAENFIKGVTTNVTTTQTVAYSTKTDVQTSVAYSTEAKSETYVTTESTSSPAVTETRTVGIPGKGVHDQAREVITTTTATTTAINTWDETTAITTTTKTETPVTTTYTTVTTDLHHGVPVSEGKQISNDVKTTSISVEGTPVITISTDSVTTSGPVTTTSDTKYATVTTQTEWANIK